jgi:hypothetical protein
MRNFRFGYSKQYCHSLANPDRVLTAPNTKLLCLILLALWIGLGILPRNRVHFPKTRSNGR